MSTRFRLLSTAFLTVAVCAATAGAASAAKTHVHVYHAFKASGKPAVRVTKTFQGSCFSGSDAANRRDAWRCLSGSALLDPCFSSSDSSKFVLCPSSGPWSGRAVKLKLLKKLPKKMADKGRPGSTKGLPWALITVKGWKCLLATGATTVVNGKRLNYTCRGTKNDLFGSPNRKHEPWTISYGPGTAKHLKHRTGIRAAWF